eukprot:COSAG05_NODE_911_length_6636_cov_56.263577_6_plen_224_part_00
MPRRLQWRVQVPPLPASRRCASRQQPGPLQRSPSPAAGACWRRSSSTAANSGADATIRFGSAIADPLGALSSADVGGSDVAATVAREILEQLQCQLAGQPPDLLLFFNASPAKAPLHGKDIARLLREGAEARWAGSTPVVVGASWGCIAPGTGVVGGVGGRRTDSGAIISDCAEERQETAALTVLGARLPGVRVLPFHPPPLARRLADARAGLVAGAGAAAGE